MKNRKGSITVEAVLVLPVFVFAIILCMFLCRVLMIQDDLQWAMTRIAKETSVETSLAKGKKGFQNPLYYSIKMRHYMKDHDISVSFLGSKYDEKTKDIYLVASYQVKMPIQFFFVKRVNITQRIHTRAFLGVLSRGITNVTDDDVYVTRTGQVYHTTLSCTHLKLSISRVLYGDIQNMRNQGGGKYKSCDKCVKGKNLSANTKVYITNFGDRYHVLHHCSGIKRSIMKIRKSQVGKRLPCTKCGE